jgi:hypothetical protein
VVEEVEKAKNYVSDGDLNRQVSSYVSKKAYFK